MKRQNRKSNKKSSLKEPLRFGFVVLALVLYNMMANAQEINFSRVQDMAIWYNQSLKTDKQMSLKLNYRNVNYQGLLAYNSVCAILDAPLLSKSAREKTNSGYFSMSVGAASDKSNQGILSNTLGLLGVSYALPISSNEVYASIGFQGMYYQSRMNTSGIAAFPDQFDQYGPINGKLSIDPVASGWSYGYFNVNAGASVFSNSQYNKWYIGASLLHVNTPYTERTKSETFKAKRGVSVQGGYKYITANADECAFNMSLNWQGSAYKHYFNLSYLKAIPSMEGGVGFGVGYRYNDAVVPNVDLRYNKATIALLYDINISSINAAGYRRTGLELALKLDF
ncbi:type IX secretion system membrane protein PorP/SprF [Chitinophagaceae bacterium 26-R-25]|nr:type IX secretion system membrane protein PorP/SprF [Chitinophagaceae bacterium 26-R-25]